MGPFAGKNYRSPRRHWNSFKKPDPNVLFWMFRPLALKSGMIDLEGKVKDAEAFKSLAMYQN